MALMRAGKPSITVHDPVASGWEWKLAAYIHNLKELGITIASVRDGPDGVSHERYHLTDTVEVMWLSDEQGAS